MVYTLTYLKWGFASCSGVVLIPNSGANCPFDLAVTPWRLVDSGPANNPGTYLWQCRAPFPPRGRAYKTSARGSTALPPTVGVGVAKRRDAPRWERREVVHLESPATPLHHTRAPGTRIVVLAPPRQAWESYTLRPDWERVGGTIKVSKVWLCIVSASKWSQSDNRI